MSLSIAKIKKFQKKIWDYYKKNKRDFPWRETTNPYYILVSEIMLQQTQTYRVEPKYISFIKKFPSLKKLSGATFQEVLTEWKGLGYNRRAVALHTIAKLLIKEKRKLPHTVKELQILPHIGPNTAASISAFVYNYPTIFVETNIRTVYIHEFFANKEKVHDKDILKLVEATLDQENSREWYYAIMDYGVYLKKSLGNQNQRSVHYKKQSTFKGSNRELRSQILDAIRVKPQTLVTLEKLHPDGTKIEKNLTDLIREGFIVASRQKKFMIRT